MIKIYTGKGDNLRNVTAEDFEITYEGAVIATYERNGYDDSDFMALVWDEGRQAVIHVQYATTRGWTYGNSATVDATDDVLAKAAIFATESLVQRMIWDFAHPAVGRKVKSLTTRGKAKGLTGTITRMMVSKFDPRGKDMIALVEDPESGRSAWVDPYRLEVIEEPDLDAFRHAAATRVRNQGVYSAVRSAEFV